MDRKSSSRNRESTNSIHQIARSSGLFMAENSALEWVWPMPSSKMTPGRSKQSFVDTSRPNFAPNTEVNRWNSTVIELLPWIHLRRSIQRACAGNGTAEKQESCNE